jgi:hypothetical protein
MQFFYWWARTCSAGVDMPWCTASCSLKEKEKSTMLNPEYPLAARGRTTRQLRYDLLLYSLLNGFFFIYFYRFLKNK